MNRNSGTRARREAIPEESFDSLRRGCEKSCSTSASSEWTRQRLLEFPAARARDPLAKISWIPKRASQCPRVSRKKPISNLSVNEGERLTPRLRRLAKIRQSDDKRINASWSKTFGLPLSSPDRFSQNLRWPRQSLWRALRQIALPCS